MGGPGSFNPARLRGVAKNTTTAAASAPEVVTTIMEVANVALQELKGELTGSPPLADVAQPVEVDTQSMKEKPQDGIVLMGTDGQRQQDYTAKDAISMIDEASKTLQGLDPSSTKQSYDQARGLIGDAKVDLIKAATTDDDSLKKSKYSDSYLEAQAARKEEERLKMLPKKGDVPEQTKVTKTDPGAKASNRLRGGNKHSAAAAATPPADVAMPPAGTAPAHAGVDFQQVEPGSKVDAELDKYRAEFSEDFSKISASHPADQLALADQSAEAEEDDTEDDNLLDDQDGQPKEYSATMAMSMFEQAKQAFRALGTSYPSNKKADYEAAHDLLKDARHDLTKAAGTDKNSLKSSEYSNAYLEAQAARQHAERVAAAGMVFGM